MHDDSTPESMQILQIFSNLSEIGLFKSFVMDTKRTIQLSSQNEVAANAMINVLFEEARLNKDLILISGVICF